MLFVQIQAAFSGMTYRPPGSAAILAAPVTPPRGGHPQGLRNELLLVTAIRRPNPHSAARGDRR